jgi:hypothetical protein
MAGGLIKKELGTPNVTGGTHAHGQDVLTGRFQSKSCIKRSYPVDFHYRYPETLRRDLHGLLGNVTEVCLDILKHFDELIGLAATSFHELLECLGRHVDLLWI